MSVTNTNIYSSLISLEANLARYQKLVAGLNAFSNDTNVGPNNYYRCLQIVSRNLAINLSAQYNTLISFLQTGRPLEGLERELEPLITQYDKHRRLWLMFAERISVQKQPNIPGQ